MKGVGQRFLKLDLHIWPLPIRVNYEVDVNGINYGVNGSTNAMFIEKLDCGVSKVKLAVRKIKLLVSVREWLASQ